MGRWRVRHGSVTAGFNEAGQRISIVHYDTLPGGATADRWYLMQRCTHQFPDRANPEPAIRVHAAGPDGGDLHIRIADYTPFLDDFPARVSGQPSQIVPERLHITVLSAGPFVRDDHRMETDAINAVNAIPGVSEVELEWSTSQSVTLSYAWGGQEDFQGTDEHLAHWGLRKLWHNDIPPPQGM